MDKISFTVNGESYTLYGSEVSPLTSLNDYLRNYLQLYGTKSMCHEGGCGACVVSVSQTHPTTKEKHTFSVNSCLVHILLCHHWDITTVEGLGNRKDGYHPVQSRLAQFNGTQCGYCTPGWVMNMYSLLEGSQQPLTIGQVENSFGGNLCRCTGYRPILDAFKSFATDVDPEITNRVLDLEDLHKVKCSQKCTRRCSVVDEEWCVIEDEPASLMSVGGTSSRWYKAFDVQSVFNVLTREGVDDYVFVAGNTGHGPFPLSKEPRIFIDISSIESLRECLVDANLVIGSGVTLTDLMKIFRTKSQKEEFMYLKGFVDHLDLVAHVPVRNIGTIGGNLAMKNAHPEFQSDIFLLLETVQAYVSLVDQTLAEQCIPMQEFLKTDLKGKLITSVKLPPYSKNNLIRSYKIMPRAQNSLAIINAGFYFKVDSQNKIETARLTFCPITPTFVRATETERALVGLDLYSEDLLKTGLRKLSEELVPADDPRAMTAQCRKAIALGLFYKAILSLVPESKLNPRYVSGARMLKRETSRGTQTFSTDKRLWPLNEPIPKLEALTQCSGEVKYACDVNSSSREVHVAFVLSTICLGEIEGFDASDALKIPGVVGFFSAKDIPGKNSFTPTDVPWMELEEEILASKVVSHHGQPIGLIAAVNKSLALKAAEMVKVTYKKSNVKPVLSIDEALVAPDKDRRIRQDASIPSTDRGDNTTHVIKGTFRVPGQYHFTMETQSCHASITEDGLLVRPATQWMDLVHVAIAKMLKIQQNKVRVEVNRVGGGYGGKAARSALVACACALVAKKLNRSASMVLPLRHNMQAIGKRQHCRADYEAGVNDEGVIQYLKLSFYSDSGFNFNDGSVAGVAGTLTVLYDSSRWDITGYSVLTDKASNTWCRAPGTTEATAITEYIMEHIAQVTGKDPIAVRISNLASKSASIKAMIDTIKRDSNYDQRKAEIASYNTKNAWKKKGIKLSIMSFPIEYSWNFSVTISIYHGDGTVCVSHSGIEMGQGINTKVAQVCAYTLKIPLEKVSVIGSNSFVSPNAMASNGSVTSDCVAYATIKACNELLDRIKPAEGELTDASWESKVKAAYEKGVNLQACRMTSPLDAPLGYVVQGACVSEVEIDVLTGQHVVSRVDLLEDVGVSLSPEIDVGQIEGAFIMGLGMWTTEDLIYDSSGRLISNDTWSYHPPGAKDIPADFRVTFLRNSSNPTGVLRSKGRLISNDTWSYHPPGAKDIPADFRVTFLRNSSNPTGVLRSKATGEPALTLSVAAALALREAARDARKEFTTDNEPWPEFDPPYNVQNILKAISPKIESFKLK